MPKIKKTACFWSTKNDLLKEYHDKEWGFPVHDDNKHFEMLTLEGAQAGLGWETILKKRAGYQKLFKEFDPAKVAEMSDAELEQCLKDENIIRNRNKVYSVRQNADVFLEIQKEFGSFDQYIWNFFNKQQIINQFKTDEDVPKETEGSKKLSEDLKKRGMAFIGPTSIYAYMQAVGIVVDHSIDCPRYPACKMS